MIKKLFPKKEKEIEKVVEIPKEFEEPESLKGKVDVVYDFIKGVKKQEDAPKRSVLDKILGKNKINKEFQLSKRLTSGATKKIKQGYALIFFIRNNGDIEAKFRPIKNEMVYIPETKTFHQVNANYTLRYSQGKNIFPTIVLPEWRLIPLVNKGELDIDNLPAFDPKEDYNETQKSKLWSLPQKVIINAMEMAQLPDSKPSMFGGKNVIWIVLGIVVALYLLGEFFK